jgi:GNAT superfamily N-acetyltransferase
MIHVRAAAIDDADDIAAAHVQGWRVGYRGLFPDEYLDAPEFESERLERWRLWTWQEFNDSELYVAVLDDRVVGLSHFGAERQQPTCDQSGTDTLSTTLSTGTADGTADSTAGEVYGFYLHPDAWGSGAAVALMSQSVDRLAARGFTGAVLWVLRDNPRARAFYEKLGWHDSGREMLWEGPHTATQPPNPVVEVQYIRTF